nr:putative late blight resistance protein homolog R1A-3 [Coffea arabica]XP_027097895.1 putative late blight resistance protein homolog R1A-3 [Coffea arabica]
MTNISFSSSTSCFDVAREYLDDLDGASKCLFESHIWELKMGISLLETFDLYIRKFRRKRSKECMCLEYDKEDRGDAESDSLRLSSISFRIQDLVSGIKHELGSAVSLDDTKRKLGRFEENMRLIFDSDIKESNICSLLLHNLLGDFQLVMDITDSILENLRHLCTRNYRDDGALQSVMGTLQEKLMFLKSFICFATLHGVKGQQLVDLLVHIEVVAINAASLISTSWFQRNDEKVCNEMESEISQLIQKKIDPVDLQVRETYIHVLTASKLSPSSHTLALEKNKHLVAEFIDDLLHIIMELTESYTSFLVPVKDQLLKLYEGARFLSVLLSQQHEKFDKLNDEMKDRIGFVLCDAGIVIFSLYKSEMTESLPKEIDLVASHMLELLKLIIPEIEQICPQQPPSSSISFPRTNELGSIDFLLETLEELESSTANSIAFPNNQIHTVREDLDFLRPFLGKIAEQRKGNEKLQALWSRISELAYRAEIIIDSTLLGGKHQHCLDVIAGDIKLMKIEAKEIYDNIRFDCETQSIVKTTIHMPSQVTAPIFNEAVVGLNDEGEIIIDGLVRGPSRLDIVAIVGMPGLGKTTLANKVYGDPLVKSHFHIRSWCCFSRAYTKHSLLVQMLCNIDCGNSAGYLRRDEDYMANRLRKLLKGNRYLIVLDDVWDIRGWDLLKLSLPDDCNGSRILLTSRLQELSLQIKLDSEPHHLRPLTDNESCELLQKKLFAKEDCPPILSNVLLHAAKNCKGLPLTVVLVAGILATTEQDCWEEVVKHLTSSIFVDNEYCMKTIELSYNNLPDYLKPCLLYFGAFQEDQEIPIRRLLWIWISEGFVQKTEGKSLEDVADDYLMDLVRRSLVMATQQRSSGGIKACRIHDLVHEFCVAKAKEESFLQILHVGNLLTFTGPCNLHRLSIHPTMTMGPTKSRLFSPNLRCLLFCGDSHTQLDKNSFKFLLSKLLRVLDFWNNSYPTSYFPREVVFLVHLRYLRIGRFAGDIPSAIANLSRLETFVVEARAEDYVLPNTIWNIETLRHLVTSLPACGFIFPKDNLEGSPDLKHLDTLSLAMNPYSQSAQKILSKLQSTRRLTIATYESYRAIESGGNHGEILMLNYMSRLESLKISRMSRDEFEFSLNLNLKKLTLSYNYWPWSKISAIGRKLPNLVVLKLCHRSVREEEWEMAEGEFCNLRFLKLSGLYIRRWTASSDNFSCLEKLVLEFCEELEEVPPCLGESVTLKMIELKRCSESAVNSVEQILQEQREWGNKDLKSVIIRSTQKGSQSREEFHS